MRYVDGAILYCNGKQRNPTYLYQFIFADLYIFALSYVYQSSCVHPCVCVLNTIFIEWYVQIYIVYEMSFAELAI